MGGEQSCEEETEEREDEDEEQHESDDASEGLSSDQKVTKYFYSVLSVTPLLRFTSRLNFKNIQND